MARLRKFSGYRALERPYTRKSKYRAKSFVRASPPHKIVRFDMGALSSSFAYRLELRVKEALQIRHNAIESARQSSNRLMEKKAGKTEYKMKIRKYPHHVLRENPLASGAGADRMSTGMQKAFGKPIGTAAQFKVNDIFMTIDVNEAHLETAKSALTRAKNKLPCRCSITVVKN
jgi:large subunit ribosomal protein L10e